MFQEQYCVLYGIVQEYLAMKYPTTTTGGKRRTTLKIEIET